MEGSGGFVKKEEDAEKFVCSLIHFHRDQNTLGK